MLEDQRQPTRAKAKLSLRRMNGLAFVTGYLSPSRPSWTLQLSGLFSTSST
jgi:hypothetical protein